MRLICPSCGACHSAESWQNDPQARQCLKIIGELPHAVSIRCLSYLSLFRPAGGRGLPWAKALRLLSEIADHISQSHIQWDGKVARPNSPMAWATAMERIAERPPKSLPLKSHGYLRSIAYEVADEVDRGAEVRRNKTERSGQYQRQEPESPAGGSALRRPGREDFDRIRKMIKGVGKELKDEESRPGDQDL